MSRVDCVECFRNGSFELLLLAYYSYIVYNRLRLFLFLFSNMEPALFFLNFSPRICLLVSFVGKGGKEGKKRQFRMLFFFLAACIFVLVGWTRFHIKISSLCSSLTS